MFGRIAGSPAFLEESVWAPCLRPEDVTTAFDRMDSAIRYGEPYVHAFRAVHVKGSEHPILGIGRAVGDKGRRPHRFVGFNISRNPATNAVEKQSRACFPSLDELLLSHPRFGEWIGSRSVADGAAAAIDHLSQGQVDCLVLVHQQLTSKEIARRLGISHHTVDQRIRGSLQILGCSQRTHAARIVAERLAQATGVRTGQPLLGEPSQSFSALLRHR